MRNRITPRPIACSASPSAGSGLWLRAGLREIRLFSEKFELLATHPRATQPGQRFTHADHLPPDKAKALTLTRQTCQAQADAIGSATSQVVTELLASTPVDRFRVAVRVLRLADTYPSARLEAAMAFGLTYGDTSYRTLKRILQERLETTAMDQPSVTSPNEKLVFARNSDELAEAILGGATWN